MAKTHAVARSQPTKPTRRGRKVVLAVAVVAVVVILAVCVGLLYSGGGTKGATASSYATAMTKAFNSQSDVTVRVSGGGRKGELITRFDGTGSYESVVAGSTGGLSNGTLLSIGEDEYTKATQAALLSTMTDGAAPLPAARAKKYAKEYANVWINMAGAPLIAPYIPGHTSGQSFFTTLGGSWDKLTARVEGNTVHIRAGKVTWTMNKRSDLPTLLAVHTTHGVVLISFTYHNVPTFVAPTKSVVPPLPVNTSLSPDSYPEGFSPYVLLYGEVSAATAAG
jgi:hypothetical protein